MSLSFLKKPSAKIRKILKTEEPASPAIQGPNDPEITAKDIFRGARKKRRAIRTR